MSHPRSILLAFGIAVALVVIAFPLASADHSSKRRPDPCPEPVRLSGSFKSHELAEKRLFRMGYKRSLAHPSDMKRGIFHMQGDYTKSVSYPGHAFGAYRNHAHIEQEGGRYYLSVQGPEPNPERSWHFGKNPLPGTRAGAIIQAQNGYEYVRWWHWEWADAKPYNDGYLGC
jgi:hypothetical protein